MSQASERRVLVPGGAGYIGSVLTPLLLTAGYRVRVLDSLLYDNSGTLAGVIEQDGFEFVRGDMRSAEQVREAMRDVTDVVVLAALVGDPVCKRNPDLARQTNLKRRPQRDRGRQRRGVGPAGVRLHLQQLRAA